MYASLISLLVYKIHAPSLGELFKKTPCKIGAGFTTMFEVGVFIFSFVCFFFYNPLLDNTLFDCKFARVCVWGGDKKQANKIDKLVEEVKGYSRQPLLEYGLLREGNSFAVSSWLDRPHWQ